MLTKTESTALLRHLWKGLNNGTISKARGRQLMDLASKIRIKRGAELPKNLSRPLQGYINRTKAYINANPDNYRSSTDSLVTLLQRNAPSGYSLVDNLINLKLNRVVDLLKARGYTDKKAWRIALKNFLPGGKRAKYIDAVEKDLDKLTPLDIEHISKYVVRDIADPFSRAVKTPFSLLRKNPKNKVMSQGQINNLKVDPYRVGYAGKAFNDNFSRYFIGKHAIGQNNFIAVRPDLGSWYADFLHGNMIEYDISKLRDNMGLPLLPTGHLKSTDRIQRVKMKAQTKALSRKNLGSKWRDILPLYLLVAKTQPGFMPWNAIKNIYVPFNQASGHTKYLKLDNWRDAFRPSKTLDMYTQLYS